MLTVELVRADGSADVWEVAGAKVQKGPDGFWYLHRHYCQVRSPRALPPRVAQLHAGDLVTIFSAAGMQWKFRLGADACEMASSVGSTGAPDCG